jgi:hypothetical protein
MSRWMSRTRPLECFYCLHLQGQSVFLDCLTTNADGLCSMWRKNWIYARLIYTGAVITPRYVLDGPEFESRWWRNFLNFILFKEYYYKILIYKRHIKNISIKYKSTRDSRVLQMSVIWQSCYRYVHMNISVQLTHVKIWPKYIHWNLKFNKIC